MVYSLMFVIKFLCILFLLIASHSSNTFSLIESRSSSTNFVMGMKFVIQESIKEVLLRCVKEYSIAEHPQIKFCGNIFILHFNKNCN
jgi:hypothetical protein